MSRAARMIVFGVVSVALLAVFGPPFLAGRGSAKLRHLPGEMTSGPESQVATGRALATWFAQLEGWLKPVPEPLLGLGLLLLAGIFIWGALIGRRRRADVAGEASAADMAEVQASPAETGSASDNACH